MTPKSPYDYVGLLPLLLFHLPFKMNTLEEAECVRLDKIYERGDMKISPISH